MDESKEKTNKEKYLKFIKRVVCRTRLHKCVSLSQTVSDCLIIKTSNINTFLKSRIGAMRKITKVNCYDDDEAATD